MATNKQLRDWARRVQQEQQRQVDAYNREVRRANDANRRAVDNFNRRQQQVLRQQQRDIDNYNKQIEKVNEHNGKADAHNAAVIADLQRRRPTTVVRYSPAEEELVQRVHDAATLDTREYDAFISYAHLDGAPTARALADALRERGARVWIDDVMQPGQSLARQIDRGLGASRCGIALITPVYLTGRFWTERELGALLHKNVVIPVLHNVSFDDVKKFSGFLGDLLGFDTSTDPVDDLAHKIASAVLPSCSEAAGD